MDADKHFADDARQHSQKIKHMLNQAAEHSREDIDKVSDPKARALFETTAEVLLGLAKAYDHLSKRMKRLGLDLAPVLALGLQKKRGYLHRSVGAK